MLDESLRSHLRLVILDLVNPSVQSRKVESPACSRGRDCTPRQSPQTLLA